MIELIRKTFTEWKSDKVPQLAAALAYYTIFSIPPLLIIALAVAGYFFNADIARNQLIGQLSGFVDAQTAGLIQSLLENSTRTSDGVLASILSFIVLLAGASGIFLQLQDALNTIWGIPKNKGRKFWHIFKNRLRSFLIVFSTGVLFLFFLLLSAIISLITGYKLGATQNAFLPEALNFIVLFVTCTLLFALLYRVIPNKEITWRDVWLGAAVTALLFLLGRYVIGFYLTITKSGSTFGAAGSLIALLIWIYYSAQIFLLGAEFTQVYANRSRSGKRSERNPLAEEELSLHLSHPDESA